MAELKAGTRLRSGVCSTEVMVVAAPSADVDLQCGGAAMVGLQDDPPGGDPAGGFDGGTQLGKRYVNEAGDLEVLCTKPGPGALSVGADLLSLKEAKPLPSSD